MRPVVGDRILGPTQDRPGLYSPRITEVAGDLGGGKRWWVYSADGDGYPIEPTSQPGIWREVAYVSNGETRGRHERRRHG